MENFSGSVVESRSAYTSPAVPSKASPKNKKGIIVLVIIEIMVVLGFLIALLITIFSGGDGASIDLIDDSSFPEEKPIGVNLENEEGSLLLGLSSADAISYTDCRTFGTIYNKYAGIDIFPFTMCEQPKVYLNSQQASIDYYENTSFNQISLGNGSVFYTITTFNNYDTLYSTSYGAANQGEPKEISILHE